MLPDFSFEKPLWQKDYLIIGVDEVGRGALAGPVGAGTVCFHHLNNNLEQIAQLGIQDSKKLTAKQREKLADVIKKNCLAFGTGFAEVEVINKKGIVFATHLAMFRAVDSLLKKLKKTKNLFLLVDGFPIAKEFVPHNCQQKAIIKGDSKSISIAAASIIAKVKRDAFMSKLAADYLVYGWERNKGYGTKEHLQMIKKRGVNRHHRLEFVD